MTWQPEEDNREFQIKVFKRGERAEFLSQFVEMLHTTRKEISDADLIDRATFMVDLCIDYLNETTGLLQ